MPGGLIQLVAYGIQDVFLTSDAQITFFKALYRRHTNFSIEPVTQYFNKKRITFGDKVSCTISRTGDLVNKVYLVIELPVIPPFVVKCNKQRSNVFQIDPITRFAWVRKIGFAIIQSIEIEIGGQIIDRHYGEWLYIWNELSNSKKYTGFSNMIGDIQELTKFSNGKNSYTLQIPLQFWFCKYYNTALPILALQYNEVKINVEFSEKERCMRIGPTQSIVINEPIVHYEQGEWIQQIVGSQQAIGLFMSFDISTRTLYYIRASDQVFQCFDPSSLTGSPGLGTDEIREKYNIVGLCSNYITTPQDSNKEKNIKLVLPSTFDKIYIPNCHLDVEYIYLDTEERFRFLNTAHEYLIEQLQLGAIQTIQFKSFQVNLSLSHPVRALFWIAQTNAAYNIKDTFNYTNSVVRDIKSDKLCGKNLITKGHLILNSIPRFTEQPGSYFNWIQPYQYFITDPEEGVNTYSFCLSPTIYQTSGTCNMSKIDLITLALELDNKAVSVTNAISKTAIIKTYGLSYNILRIINGLGGLLFTN